MANTVAVSAVGKMALVAIALSIAGGKKYTANFTRLAAINRFVTRGGAKDPDEKKQLQAAAASGFDILLNTEGWLENASAKDGSAYRLSAWGKMQAKHGKHAIWALDQKYAPEDYAVGGRFYKRTVEIEGWLSDHPKKALTKPAKPSAIKEEAQPHAIHPQAPVAPPFDPEQQYLLVGTTMYITVALARAHLAALQAEINKHDYHFPKSKG